jgi:polyferredoxin
MSLDLAGVKAKPKINLLHIPFIGRFLRWRWGRLIPQLALLLVAALVIYDGFTGPELAPANNATVLVWVHYRGFVVLALLLAGNLFCAACPFTLPRTLARRLSLAGGRFPRRLRTKWLALASLLLIFWLYEWLDLWASPALTAWVVIAYFAAAYALEAWFTESPFCKYVCPLGAFNFVHSTVSPLQITEVDREVCRTCPGKECVNGDGATLGCGTELFVPTMRSNLDCILCLDCARACPYDNVALAVRKPLAELIDTQQHYRPDLTMLVGALTFISLSNAFAMVPPVFDLQAWLLRSVGLQSEAVRVGLYFIVTGVVFPALALGSAAAASRLASSIKEWPLSKIAGNFVPALIPLGFGIWLGHYGFHFITGGLTIIPVLQSFALDHGLEILGATPNWDVGFLLPLAWIFPLQVASVLVGFLAGLIVLARRSLRLIPQPVQALIALLPWALLLTMLTIASLSIFSLPMEMRGALSGI